MTSKVVLKSEALLENIIREHQFLTSGKKELAASPKELLLSGVAGCTALDVEAILNKMRVEYSDLSVEANAELTSEHPKVFTKIHIIYSIRLKHPEDKDKVIKAIELSQEKYCGVSAMLAKAAPISWELQILS